MKKIAFLLFLITLLSLSACSQPTGMRVGGIEYVYSEAQGRAFRAASSEAEGLPKAFDIESIYTEGAVLRNDLIMELLSIRGLKFIETQIRRSTYKPTEGYGYLGMSFIRDELGLNIGQRDLDKTYARIELSNSNDPRCIPKSALPGSIANRIDSPPFLPGTCIALTIIDQPTARYHLIYESKHEWGPPFGYWTLIDVSSGNRLGSITTADSAERPQNGNTGHSFLSWRIRRTPGTFQVGPQLVMPKAVNVAQLPSTKEGLKVVSANEVRRVPVTESKFRTLFGSAGWAAVVESAKRSRWGYYESSLLDWTTRTLTQLRSEYGRGAFALEGGFFVISEWWDYRSMPATLERYDSNGNHVWSVQIPPPNLGDNQSCGVGRSSIGITMEHVILYGRCGSLTEVLMVEIPRKKLPAF